MTTHDTGPDHNCARAGCKTTEQRGPGYFIRMDNAKSSAKRSAQAATKARHKEHGIEHARGGCR